MPELPLAKRGQYRLRDKSRRHYIPTLVSFPTDLIPKLDEAATARGFNNRSEFVRAACRAFLETEGHHAN